MFLVKEISRHDTIWELTVTTSSDGDKKHWCTLHIGQILSFITILERIKQYQRKNTWVCKNHVNTSFWKPTSCTHCFSNGTWKDLAHVNNAKMVAKSDSAHSNRESYLRNSKNENGLYIVILGYRASPIAFQNSLKRSAEGTFYFLERKSPLTWITSLVFSCMFF